MSEKKLLIANWKMYLTSQESLALVKFLNEINLADIAEVIICPMATVIRDINEVIQDRLHLGAQNCFWDTQGHYTGEISPADLKSLGCEYVIIGHSERREHLGETDEMINKKIKAVLAADLIPILCIGEKLEEKKQGRTKDVVSHQLKAALDNVDLSKDQSIIIAYEPVWAIYPSQLEVDPLTVEDIADTIKKQFIEHYSQEQFDNQAQIIYGGSVNHENIKEFIKLPSISGVLIGKASTELDQFEKLINSISNY